MKKVLFMAGNSGSGKSYLTSKLWEDYSNKYKKLRQCTTRPRRSENENEYDYISKEEYLLIEKELMANTIVNGNCYGTYIKDVVDDGRISIVIVNALGLKNGIEYSKSHNIDYRIIFLENDTPFEIREDFRDTDKEKEDILGILASEEEDKYKKLMNSTSNPISIPDLHEKINELFNL